MGFLLNCLYLRPLKAWTHHPGILGSSIQDRSRPPNCNEVLGEPRRNSKEGPRSIASGCMHLGSTSIGSTTNTSKAVAPESSSKGSLTAMGTSTCISTPSVLMTAYVAEGVGSLQKGAAAQPRLDRSQSLTLNID